MDRIGEDGDWAAGVFETGFIARYVARVGIRERAGGPGNELGSDEEWQWFGG